MKYTIFGDMHGTDLTALDYALSHENPDKIICLGDFDQAYVIKQFINLEKKYRNAGKEVVTVPGNHDHAILNGFGIDSGALRRQGKTSWELHKELEKEPDAKAYLDGLVNSKDTRYTTHRVRIFLDENKFNKDYQTIVIHGAYDGDLSSFPDCPSELRDLWTRLKGDVDHEKNFAVMKSKGYNVMIRGHDHEPACVSKDTQNKLWGFVPDENKPKSQYYRLYKNWMHTIKPGALYDGWFATIDTNFPGENVPILSYSNLNSPPM